MFEIKSHEMTDGSGTLYEIVTPEGERIASAADDVARLRALCAALNDACNKYQTNDLVLAA